MEMIRGGRASLRAAVFMPTLVVIRFNADLKRKEQQLVEGEKAPKLAITAVMRKLILPASFQLAYSTEDGQRFHGIVGSHSAPRAV